MHNLHPHSSPWEGLDLLTHNYSSYDFVLRNISHGKYQDSTGEANHISHSVLLNAEQSIWSSSTPVGFGPMRLLSNSLAQL